ncbi:MAG: hypothetical protein K9L26_04705 [Candidatus Izimaplasma sp.]|nr:hypothetical protein [Candidatus Izimaplasma bacterium]
MEKYNGISKITTQFLDGELSKLEMSYNADKSLDLTVQYQDDNGYWYDYEVVLNLETGKIYSATHQSEGYLNKVSLDRKKEFEMAIQNYLLVH